MQVDSSQKDFRAVNMCLTENQDTKIEVRITLLRVIPIMICQSEKIYGMKHYFGILSGISSDILSGILSGIFFDIHSDILFWHIF